MNQIADQKTARVVGAMLVLAGLYFTVSLFVPMRLVVQYYQPDLAILLIALGTGLGFVSAAAMIPVGLLLMGRHPWAPQGVQLTLIGWVFANGFALLDVGLISFVPIHASLLCGGVMPLIAWLWLRGLKPQSQFGTSDDDD